MHIVNLESKHSINSQQICTLKNQPADCKSSWFQGFANAPDSISWGARGVRAVGFAGGRARPHQENEAVLPSLSGLMFSITGFPICSGRDVVRSSFVSQGCLRCG